MDLLQVLKTFPVCFLQQTNCSPLVVDPPNFRRTGSPGVFRIETGDEPQEQHEEDLDES